MDNWHAFNIVWKPGKFGKSEVSEERMNTEPDKLKWGMGDIFVKLAILNES